ncbi:UNVERIFIED_CONTAM: hypothetical protein Scaly_1341700 [Sesamum calycinum]|uniref:Rhodanese domain-containing protein n=1 Tax=Sesamum calycinum TaxID=2727403 RepID=A0AAW2PN45_9LAMI
MLASWRARPVLSNGCGNFRRGFCCRAEDQSVSVTERQNKKKVVIVGSGWAGLGAAHHLCKQGFDVTVLEGGYELGPKTKSLSPDDAGIRGFWYPYRNIFNLVDELGLKPFTSWTKSAQYSEEGLEVKIPYASNVSSGFDGACAWTFFDLSAIYDEHKDSESTIVQVDLEKCYVTGVEAANRVVDYVGEGGFGRIVGVEEDEPHIQSLRTFNRNLYDIRAQLPFSDYFLQ